MKWGEVISVTCYSRHALFLHNWSNFSWVSRRGCIIYTRRTKNLAGVQRRRGPDASGIGGLLQPIADGLKLIGKELIRPITSSVSIFY